MQQNPYYYSVNYNELQKRIDRVESSINAKTLENVRIEDYTKLSIEDSLDTKYCELSQNKTNITSIENISKNKTHPSNEQARNEVFRILSQPRQATVFWGQFKRSVVNVSEQVERDRALGVSNPSTPVWTRERIEPSIEEAAEAGKKITAVNDATVGRLEAGQIGKREMVKGERKSESLLFPEDPWNEDDRPQPNMREILATRKVQGFCPKGRREASPKGYRFAYALAYRSAYQQMPKVSKAEVEAEERKQIKLKTNIATMPLAEINDYLKDPILRAQLTPQLINSNYELIMDYLGQIIGVKLSEVQIRERRSLSSLE